MSKSNIPISIRRLVRERALGYCEYCFCHESFGTGPFNIEHIIPSISGGTDDLENLAFSCSGCNCHKFIKTEAIDPVSEQFVPLFNPRKQQWQEHFLWNESATEIIGSTPSGRATIGALQMNRLPLINLRKGMVLLGQHPPNNLPAAV